MITGSSPMLCAMFSEESPIMLSWSPLICHFDKEDGCMTEDYNDYYGKPIPAYKKGYSLFSASHLPEKVTVFGIGQRTQDIYNFTELITSHVISQKKSRKYTYKANFSAAVHICRQFLLGNIFPPDLETLSHRIKEEKSLHAG